MSGIAIGAAVIAGGATIYAANQSADAAEEAANTQAGATGASIAEQRAAREQAQRNIQPFVDTAHRLLPIYEGEINKPLNVGDVTQDPGYQFGLSEGQKAIDRKIAAGGGRVSGAAIKAAARFGTDYGSTKYGQARSEARLDREGRLSRLGQLAGLAPIVASANVGTQSANAISGLLSSGGDAAAAAQLSRGNIWGGATNQLAALASRGLRNYSPGGSSGGGFDTPYADEFEGTGFINEG